MMVSLFNSTTYLPEACRADRLQLRMNPSFSSCVMQRTKPPTAPNTSAVSSDDTLLPMMIS